MKRVVGPALALAFAATPAQAQDRHDPEDLRTSLTEMLSLLTFGSVSVPVQSAQVVQSGGDFRVRLPLSGFAAPANAAAEVVARPDANGIWDITSLAFPSAGALGTSIDQAVSYTIGQQAIRGRLDPKLVTPSTLTADLSGISVHSLAGGQNTEQAIERVTLDGRLSGTSGGKLDLAGRDSATNWHSVSRDPNSNGLVRRVDGHFAVSDLDRTQGVRLMTAARSFISAARSHGRQPGLSPAERDGLRAMLDATPGLLTRIEAEETLDGLKFDVGHGSAGTLGRLKFHLKGEAEDQRLNAAVNIAMDELAVATLSPDLAAFVPHHLTARSVLAGVKLGPLMAFLRTAIGPNADQAMLQKQATALLNIPGARAAIESIAFDAGPLHVLGSARFQPRADGEVGVDIHISASGIDAVLAQAQNKPSLQGAMPFVFIAKGLGRAQGNSIVWDISFGGGPLTVNGVPFGQPQARTR
jgi:hypothetical protein